MKWLSNVVVVKEKNGKNKMCIDFKDQKAFPKDPFSLPYIDTLVDATAEHEMISFIMPSQAITKYSCVHKSGKK